MILRRFENDILFEELGHWNGLDAMANTVIGNMMAVIFEKYGILHKFNSIQVNSGYIINF